MPGGDFLSMGVKPDVKTDLEKFRGELIAATGKKVCLSDALRIALRMARGNASEAMSRETSD